MASLEIKAVQDQGKSPHDHKPTTLDQFPPFSAFDEVFTVEVGNGANARTLHLHKGLATFYSGFFVCALKRETFKEGEENCIKLPEEDYDDFRTLVNFIYSRQLCCPEDRDLPFFVRMWVMGDKYDIPLLSNSAINEMHKLCVDTKTSPTGILPTIYSTTLPLSELRRWAVSAFTAAFNQESKVRTIRENYHGDFTSELVWDLFCERLKKGKWLDICNPTPDLCSYHVHFGEEKCKKV